MQVQDLLAVVPVQCNQTETNTGANDGILNTIGISKAVAAGDLDSARQLQQIKPTRWLLCC
jgi:hypothetical protein